MIFLQQGRTVDVDGVVNGEVGFMLISNEVVLDDWKALKILVIDFFGRLQEVVCLLENSEQNFIIFAVERWHHDSLLALTSGEETCYYE